MDTSAPDQTPMSWRDYVMMGLGVCLFIGVPVIFMTMVVVVDRNTRPCRTR